MTWTYTVTALATSQLMQVRRLIGDVLTGDQQMQDEEITFELGNYNNIYSAAAACCRDLAAQYARKVDIAVGEMRTSYSQSSRRYSMMAADLEMRGNRGALPYGGAMSIADKNNVATDTDRPPPDFNRGQFDDRLPVGPVGEQTPGNALPDVDTDFPG